MSLTVQNLTKRFTASGTPAVADVSFVAPSGGITTLLGPSGSGKSTVLRMVAGLEQPDSGQVLFGEEDVTRLPAQKRGLGFVFQSYALFKHMNVRANVAFGLGVRKVPKDERAPQGRRAALAGPAGRPRRALSRGAVRRAAAAGGVRPRAGHLPQGLAARRAVRRARRPGARRAARLAAPPSRRAARHHAAGHPRSGRGDGGLGPGGGHARGARGADRLRRARSTIARRRRSWRPSWAAPTSCAGRWSAGGSASARWRSTSPTSRTRPTALR